MYYVYLHTNKVNGKKYCGITNNIEKRWRSNGIAYKPYSGRIYNRKFWNAIQKYGWDNFEHEILFEVNTQEEAWEKEKEIIKELKLNKREFGYNIAPGGNGGKIYKVHPKGFKGKSHSNETKKRLREFTTNNNPMKSIKWGKTHEHPKGMLGKNHTEETKKRISDCQKGKFVSLETKQKISDGLKGKVKSKEHIENLSKSLKKRFENENVRANCSKYIKVIFPNNDCTIYKTVTSCLNDLGISHTIYKKLIDKDIMYNPKPLKYKHLQGIKMITLDDTEVTYETKVS